MNAVFLDAETLEDCDLTVLRAACGQLKIYSGTAPAEVAERVSGADIVIVNKVKIVREVIAAARQMKLICVVATGVDCIDLEAAAEFGVTTCNCQAYGTNSVVQHVWSSILALHTNLLQYHSAIRNGRWQQAEQFCFLDYPIREIGGKTLGIVGYGNLGKGVAEVAKGFGMDVMLAARPGGPPGERPLLCEILPKVDVLSLHCPLTDETRDLIGKKELQMMKPTAFLVNAARGGIVNEQALLEALRSGSIAGAAMDVLTVEPPRQGNQLLDAKLSNLIITPHIAWASTEARQRIVVQTAENIEAYTKGKPVRVVE